MSKLTQIERELLALNPAGFQRLCDSYLRRLGYERINSVGLAIGTDKVAPGTPDTLITQPDGTYVFAEYSTQQEGLAAKFAGDIAKCFDEEKTGIPVSRIREIVLCHNSRLSPEQEHELAEECRNHGVIPSIYGPGVIAYDLYQKYPGLARDFLGVEVDTGQILPPEEFVAAYNRSAFAAPLDTAFRFREEELERIRRGLEANDLVLLAGRAGVGKTRLALEACRRHVEAHPDVQVRCIFNRGPDIFQDLRVHFSAPGRYLILIDDTNRVNRFEYALQLLQDQRDDQEIKIIATVRDYALDSTLEAAAQVGSYELIELTPLTEEQIKELVREGFGIQNHLYLERIAFIAQGNPRLAVMAARVAERENTLQSIGDVTSLYDEYFASIRQDIGDLSDPTLLQVAGIISFFRVVDRSNAKLMGAISDAFGVSAEAFWESARRLHDIEVVDLYENEVVKVSDQVLSTYLFYLAFFRERALDFTVLLEHFFPSYRRQLIDALNPVLGAFNAEAITESLRPHVDRAWSVTEQRGDESALLDLIDVFWFVKPTDSLVYVRNKIRELEPAPVPLDEVKYTVSREVPPSPSLLGILDNFRYADDASLKAAVTLLLNYLEKRPAELPIVLRMLTERYGMTHRSHLSGFHVERQVTDLLWERVDGGANELFSRLFLAVAEPLLHTHFQTHESKGELSISIINFDLTPTTELLELRRMLWQRIFALYSIEAYNDSVLQLLQKHSSSGYLVAGREIVARDAEEVQAFFGATLDPSEYAHCVIVQDYLDMLDRLGVEADGTLRTRFTNEAYALYELLSIDRGERRDLGWEEYQRVRRERLAAHTATFDAGDFEQFFQSCAELFRAAGGQHDEYEIQNGVREVLIHLAGRDGTLYQTALDHYLHAGNTLNLGPWMLVDRLIEAAGPDRAYEILSAGDYPQKGSWLFGYFMGLPPADVTAERLQQLYGLCGTAGWREVLWGDYLLKFRPVDEAVVVRVTRTLVTRAGAESEFGRALSSLFDGHSEISRNLREFFAGEVDLLKQAYFAACQVEPSSDHDGQAFNQLIDLDAGFAAEWVSWVFSQREWLSRRDDSRNYAFIWRRGDHRELMDRIIEAVRTQSVGRILLSSYLETFFVLTEGTPDIQGLYERQDAFLDEVIERWHSDPDYMQTIFDVVRNFSPERRQGRIATFLRHNQDFEAFSQLPLEPSSWGWSGSAVPMLQGRVDFLESLLPMLRTIELLDHKQHVEHLIKRLREDIEREKRSDFMRGW